jgi:hypothetical protein
MKSLLTEASLILLPNGYKEGKLYSTVPSNGVGDFTVVRATTATRVNSAGLVELVPYNLFTYSEQFDNGAWVKASATITTNATIAPNGTLTADKAIATNTVSATRAIYQSFTPVSGLTYTISIYVKASEYTKFTISEIGNGRFGSSFDLVAETSTSLGGLNYVSSLITNEGNGWYKCSIVATGSAVGWAVGFMGYPDGATPSTSGVSYAGNGVSGVFIWGAQLVESSISKAYFPTTDRLNIPRLDYSNGSCPSLLVEPQRTNVLAYSNNFTLGGGNWFNFSGANPIANQGISPDGINNAWTLPSNSTLTTEFGKNIGQAIGDKVTASIYAKGSETAFNVYIQNVINTDILGTVTVNLTTGLITSGSGNVQNMGNGWYRISVTGTSTITNGFARPTFKNPNSACLIYGAQYEAGAYATSYIPTTLATVTRNVDQLYKQGISSLIGQTEGTLYIDFIYRTQTFNLAGLTAISDASTNNRVIIWNNFTLNTLGLQLKANNVNVINNVSIGTFIVGTRYKIAIGYKSGSTVVYVNGIQVISNSSTFTFSNSMTNFIIGNYEIAFSTESNNLVNSSALFLTKLTNDQLELLTGTSFNTYAEMASYYNYTLQ